MTLEFPSAKILIDVPFYDVDAANVVWHGHYAKYFEVARCHLLDTINYNYAEMKESGYAWPVIDMRIRYSRPAKFCQKLCITATITEIDPRLMIKFLVTDAQTGERLTRGYTSQVAIDMETGEMLMAAPSVLKRRIAQWKDHRQQNSS